MVSRFLTLSLVVLFLTGCWSGTTYVYTSNGASYDIYKVNDTERQLVCLRGEPCKLRTRGTPDQALLQAVDENNNVVGSLPIRRSITLASILWMPFSYCVSLFVYQAYDDDFMIYINAPIKTSSSWSVEVDPVTQKGKIRYNDEKEETDERKDAHLDSNGDIVWE